LTVQRVQNGGAIGLVEVVDGPVGKEEVVKGKLRTTAGSNGNEGYTGSNVEGAVGRGYATLTKKKVGGPGQTAKGDQSFSNSR